MNELLPFFIILTSGLIVSTFLSKLHLPWVIALIIGGIIIGPHTTNTLHVTPTIELFSQIGLIFLMFMAGLEIKLSSLGKAKKKISSIALLNGGIPFIVGTAVGYYFLHEIVPALLLGIIFISSSIAVVIPSLEASNLLYSRVGKSIISATIFEDIASLVLLSALLQSVDKTSHIPLPLLYISLPLFLYTLKKIIPELEKFFVKEAQSTKILFQQELRSVFVLLLGTVIVFEIIGLHPIIAGFFAGLVLSDTIKTDAVKDRIRTISYGIFIPIFFVVVGMKTDLSTIIDTSRSILIPITIILASVLSKIGSGWLAGIITGFTQRQALLIGSATIPQLSTTLAVAISGFELGILSQDIVTTMIMLSVVTTFIGPLLINKLANQRAK